MGTRDHICDIFILEYDVNLEKGVQMAEECCPEFHPEPWDGKVLEWDDKRFVKDSVFTILHMPLNFGRVMRRLDEKVRGAGAEVPDWLCLSDHTSRWNMDVYMAVDREIPNQENVTLSGKYLSKVYEGPYKDTGRWCEDFENYARERGFEIRKWYMWYTTCPRCAKKYGKNYVAIIAEVAGVS
jgi:DNA modification methylase